MHFSVLLQESIQYLAVRPDGVYLDATAGLGGHTAAIAAKLETGFVIANDRDAESLALAEANTRALANHIRYHRGPFSELKAAVAKFGNLKLDGLLADLGVSRYQLTSAERGFSLQVDGPVDMRMDRESGPSAGDLVNFTAEEELADLIFQLGEERRSRRIARAIVRARPIRSTLHLAEVIEKAAHRTSRIHPATQTFMALRLAVNDEMTELDSLLQAIPEMVKPGGRVVFLTFMSTEDRKVKRAFQEWAREGHATVLTKHVLRPTEDEIQANPASRSAKLRAAEIISKD